MTGAEMTPARLRQGRAILMMIGAVFCFTIMDASVKALAPKIGVLPALWARYAGQMLLVFILVLPRLKSVATTRLSRTAIRPIDPSDVRNGFLFLGH